MMGYGTGRMKGEGLGICLLFAEGGKGPGKLICTVVEAVSMSA